MAIRPRALVATAAVAGALVGCSAGDASVNSGDVNPRAGVPSSMTGTPATSTPGPTAVPSGLGSLTGRPTAAQNATRPVVAVAVAGGAGRPAPSGLDKADLVYVAFPSGERQRALALFQSQDSTRVGPVDDTRPMDANLLPLFGGAVLEHSGGSPGFVKRLEAAKIPQFSTLVEPSYFQWDAATGSWYGSTSVARSTSGARPTPPGLLLFAPETATAGPVPRPVRIDVAAQPEILLTYDPSRRLWRGVIGNLPVQATNVLIQSVTYDRLDLPHSGGRFEGNPLVLGSGKATMLTGRQVAAGTWNRPGRETLTSFVDAHGVPIRLVPGVTWVLVVPNGSRVTL